MYIKLTTYTKEYRVQNTEYRTQNTEYKIHNKEYRIQNTEYRIHNTEYRIENTEYRIQNTKYRIQNTEYRIQNRETHEHKTTYGPLIDSALYVMLLIWENPFLVWARWRGWAMEPRLFWAQNGTRLTVRCHFTGPKKSGFPVPNPSQLPS
jgi:hypothetical protein